MNFHSFPNSSVWRSAGAPNHADCFPVNGQVQSWGARGPSIASDNAVFWGANKPGASNANTDTRSWGGRGTAASELPGAHAGAGNRWGSRGPSVVGDNHKPAAAPNWNGGTSWSTAGSDRAWGGAGSASWSAPQQAATQWAPKSAPLPRPAAPPEKPVTDFSWANAGATAASQPKASGSVWANWSTANPPGTGTGTNPATGSGNGSGSDWVNAGTGSSVGGGSQSGNGTTTGSGNGSGSDWVNGGTGTQNGNGTQNGGAADEAGESSQTDETTTGGTDNANGSGSVDAGSGNGAGETGNGEAGSGNGAGETGNGETGSGNGAGETGNGETGSDSGTDENGNGNGDGSGETGSGETGSGETGSGETGSGETGSGETGSGGEAETQPVELDATQQLDNIQFLGGLVGDESPSEADMTRLVQIYNSFRLSPTELTSLRTMAQNATARMFATEGQDFAAHAQNWTDYSEEQRQGAVEAFFQVIADDLGLETSISFFNTPPTEAGLKSHGRYDPPSDELSVNVNMQVHGTLPEAMTTVFHEIVHAYYYQQTAHISRDDIPSLLESGELTYTQALTHLNVFPPLYLAEEDHGLVNYTLNPHEQLAFTGQYLFDQAIIDAGYEHERVIANDNPLFINMQQHGFA